MVIKKKKQKISEPVWTYRGYELKSSEFVTAMVHFFRAEVSRANAWRQRLDTTTNWAVVTTGAVISFAFSQTETSHLVILLDLILVTLFLVIEARRYRYYELWSYRVRLMETDFFASMLVPPFQPSPEWSEALAESLLHPKFPVSEWEALGRRLRRNYLWIYIIIGLSWVSKISLFPTPVSTWPSFVERAALGAFPGEWIIAIAGTFLILIVILGLGTIGLQSSPGEVLPRFDLGEGFFGQFGKMNGNRDAWFRPVRKRQQLLTFIVTDLPAAVSKRILKDTGRGVTILSGKGAYTQQSRSVLMIALTVTEIPHLKSIVNAEDPNAFVIVSPAQGIYGKGFSPLEEK